jgi:tRNA-specific 2-thiouridylase
MEALLLEDCYFPYEMPHKFDAAVKLRSQGISLPVHVEKKCDNEVLVHFDVPVRLSSPGQSAVFYEDDRVLGGGVVSRLILLKNRP